jgi:cytoskeletal protein RodZ
MFEIGNSLHEARVRQAVSLQAAEVGTKIRAKYLKALEEEQFDALPAQTYVKGFLRTYADFLGLDGQLYVDEYNSRFVAGAEDDGRPLRPRRSQVRPERRRSGAFESRAVLVTLAGIAIVAALVIVAWKSGNGNQRGSLATQTPVAKPVATPARRAASNVAHLVVSAQGGNSLLEVHSGSAAGRLLFQGTLLRGKSVSFDGKRLWVDVTAPKNVVTRLNGRLHRIPGTKPRVVIVTAGGIETASIG